MKSRHDLLAELEEAKRRIAQLEERQAGEALRGEKQFTRILLENLGEGVVVCDAQGKLIFFNRTAREWHGLEAVPLTQGDWARHYGLRESDGVTPLPEHDIPLVRAFRGEHVRNAAMSILAQGRPLRHVLSNAAPFFDANGRMLGAVTIMSDVTERMEMEQALESNQAQLALAMDMAKLVRWERDLATGTYTLNEQFYALYGTTAEREGGMLMSGETYRREFVHPDDQAAVAEVIAKSTDADQHNPTVSEHRIIRRDGTVRHISVRFFTLKDASGRPVKRIGANQDITDQKKMEQALLESQATLRRFADHIEKTLRKTQTVLSNILESMPSAIIALDTRGMVTHWNRFASDLGSAADASALGKPLEEVFPCLASQAANVKLAMLSGRQKFVEKMPFVIGEEPRLLDIVIYPLVAEGVEGAVLRLDDVTRRVQLEEMMVQTEKMMTVGSLAGGMAHEINNPLAGILHSVQNLRRRLSPGLETNIRAAQEAGCSMESLRAYLEKRDVSSFLDSISLSGERAASIVKNMLGFIRKSPSTHAATSLPSVVDRAVGLASADYDLKKKYDFRHIAVVREYQEDLPDVVCASMEIEQAVFNLLANAAHALTFREAPGPAPRIVLRVFREGTSAVIQIEDNGPGMDEGVRRKIFEPFFTTKDVGQGTGLGLSVAYFIVTRNHGGTIAVDSGPGRGAAFTIRLPLTPDQHGAGRP